MKELLMRVRAIRIYKELSNTPTFLITLSPALFPYADMFVVFILPGISSLLGSDFCQMTQDSFSNLIFTVKNKDKFSSGVTLVLSR
jgi:hypothetical protein